MKLIQLNCWTGRLANPLQNFLNQEDPDILCLQEAIDMPGGDEVIFLTVDRFQQAMKAKDSSAFHSPVFSFNYFRRRAAFGNAIISKLPIVKKETIFTHGDFAENLDYIEDESNMRNLQHAVIELPGKQRLNVLNHHGYHIEHHKNGDEETLRQCKLIADYASALKGPAILTGDFNLAPTSKSIKQIDKVLTNLVVENGTLTTRTKLTNKTEVCDYIFVSREIKVKKFTVSDEVVSDHKALILEFELNHG